MRVRVRVAPTPSLARTLTLLPLGPRAHCRSCPHSRIPPRRRWRRCRPHATVVVPRCVRGGGAPVRTRYGARTVVLRRTAALHLRYACTARLRHSMVMASHVHTGTHLVQEANPNPNQAHLVEEANPNPNPNQAHTLSRKHCRRSRSPRWLIERCSSDLVRCSGRLSCAKTSGTKSSCARDDAWEDCMENQVPVTCSLVPACGRFIACDVGVN